MNFIQTQSGLTLMVAKSSQGSMLNTILYLPVASGNTSYSLSDAWTDQGCFIYLQEAPQNLQDFYTYITTSLNVLQTHCRILWISNQGQTDMNQWIFTSLSASDQNGNNAVISTPVNIILKNYGICIGNGCTVTFTPESNESSGGFGIEATGNATLLFTTNGGSSGAAGSLASVFISANDANGKPTFSLVTDVSGFNQLNANISYFYPDAIIATNINALSFPVFTVNNSLTLYGTINPCAGNAENQLALYFQNPESGATASSITLTSNFITGNGNALMLQSGVSSCLVLALQPTSNPALATDPYCLVPSGTFNIVANGSTQFLPGYSGVEFIQTGVEPAAITFIPGCNAFAPNFNPADVSAIQPILNNTATTSWAYLGGSDMTYCAQPEHAVLHATAPFQGTFLSPIFPQAGILQATPVAGLNSGQQFPILPVSATAQATATIAQEFEKTVLSVVRRTQIYELNKSGSQSLTGTTSTNSDTVVSATPGGLNVELDSTLTNWKTLTLGKDGQQNPIRLHNVTGTLKAAFQTTNQFMVISDPAVLQGVLLDNQASICGWNFNLDPLVWNNHNTIMLIKYYPGKSVSELAGNTSLWLHGNAFNLNNPSNAQTIINKSITDAGLGTPAQVYQNFNSVVNNPDWNGVLFLNADVPLSELPSELEGIAAGIDKSLFYAHHLGINFSPVRTARNGNPVSTPGAFFGLINYTAPTGQISYNTGDYDFEVNSLCVEFVNSQISYFSSQIQVTLNKLFNEYSTSANNTILLNGSYQDSNGNPSYRFIAPSATAYTLSSPTINTVTISSAQFVTIQSLGGWGGDALVHTRFVFSGAINFQNLSKADLFSYNSLEFDNLWLDMAFNVSHPASSRSFQFDPSAITFAKPLATDCRQGGFTTQFPMKLKGLVYNPGGNTAIDKGYLTASMPATFSGIGSSYYGLVYDLPLGSMGALAPKTSFTAELMLCWTPQPNYTSSPQSGSYPAELKIKLPFGGSGNNFLSIEGVINLGIEGVQLYVDDNGTCTIKLRDFGLHVLSVTLPPSGTTDIFIFGNPGSGSGALAWYAAYSKQTSYAQDPYNN